MAPRKKTVAVETAEPIEEKMQPTEIKQTEKTVSCEGYDYLNVREQPAMNAKIVNMLPHGFKVMAGPENGGWCAVDGGFVRANYLE